MPEGNVLLKSYNNKLLEYNLSNLAIKVSWGLLSLFFIS
jgi:hypothetical protein